MISRPFRCRLILARLLFVATGILSSQVIGAPHDVYSINIARGGAAETLMEFSRQTGLQLLFDYRALRGFNTRAVTGDLKAAEALAGMLKGAGLSFEFVNERTVSITPDNERSRHNNQCVPWPSCGDRADETERVRD